MKRIDFDPDKILTSNDLKDYVIKAGQLNKVYNFLTNNTVID